jgi:hypothetical protein
MVDIDPDIGTILAFSFGNRLVSGNGGETEVQPGPVNDALADVVLRLHRMRGGAVVRAQWEIASVLALRGELADNVLHPIRPGRGQDGEVRYLSTRGVVDAAIQGGGGVAALGRVVVVAHHDHVDRCVRLCRKKGIDAVAPEDTYRQWLPSFYDSQSGQPWTRNRPDYLRHEKAMESRP